MALMSQQPTCNPVFKRFLSRLLKGIQRLSVVGPDLIQAVINHYYGVRFNWIHWEAQ